MHIVIGLLGGVAGLFYVMTTWQTSGTIDPFNPRRLRGKNKLVTQPLYSLKRPIDAAAVLILGIAKCEGEISQEQKKSTLSLFKNEFNMSHEDAQNLFNSSAFLLKDDVSIVTYVDKILKLSQSAFTQAQIHSLLSLMSLVSEIDSAMSEEQEQMIQSTQNIFEGAGNSHSIY